MIPLSMAEAKSAIYGAFRLFLRDGAGANYLRSDGPALLKSFWAAVIVLPGWFLLDYFTQSGVWLNVPLFPGLVMELAGYSMIWTVWPLFMLMVVKFLDLDDRYNLYIVAQNWMAVPSVILYLVAIGGATILQLSAGTVYFVGFVSQIWVLFYHFFVVRVTLQVSVLMAIGFVLANFFLNIMLLDIRMLILMGD